MSDEGELSPLRRPGKSEAAFRTISEVSDDLGVSQHVLRFWESKFPQVKPLKRGGGRRYYRPEDVVLLGRIRDLLYTEGYTIKGVQKLLREGGFKRVKTDEAAPALAVSDDLLPNDSVRDEITHDALAEDDLDDQSEQAESLADIYELSPDEAVAEPEAKPEISDVAEVLVQEVVQPASLAQPVSLVQPVSAQSVLTSAAHDNSTPSVTFGVEMFRSSLASRDEVKACPEDREVKEMASQSETSASSSQPPLFANWLTEKEPVVIPKTEVSPQWATKRDELRSILAELEGLRSLLQPR